MKIRDAAASICEPHEMKMEAMELINIIRNQPDGALLQNTVERILSGMVNSGEVAVWSGIDCFLKELVTSGNCPSEFLPGVSAVQELIGESYGDVLTGLRKQYDAGKLAAEYLLQRQDLN